MNHARIFLLLCLGLVAVNANSMAMQFDFAGRTYSQPTSNDDPVITGQFSGYVIIDTGTPDTNDSPFIGIYENAILTGYLVVNGQEYDILTDGFLRVGVINELGLEDSFSIFMSILNDEGMPGEFGLQLVDSSRTIFGSDAIPTTTFSHTDFDAFDFELFNGTLGFFLGISGAPSLTIDYASYHPIPVPAALWLFLSACLGFGAVGRRKT